ncbi:MAG: hypothetical protein ACW98Y_18755 [Candidatus Thorarchaeota archaeon]|jgi:hypothetical protein
METKDRSDTYMVGQLLVVFGAIVTFVFGVLFLLNVGVGVTFLPSLDLLGVLGTLNNLIVGILLVVLSLVTLATFGVLNIPQIKLEKNLIVLIFLGIVTFLVGGTLGGVLVIIGSILMIF